MIPSFLFHGLRVRTSPSLPYESTDPKRPGTIHAVRLSADLAAGIEETLLVSQQVYERLLAEVKRD